MSSKSIKKIILGIIAICVIFPFSKITFAQTDLLKDVFAPAQIQDTILNLGDTKESIGRNLLQESSSYTIGGKDKGISSKDSLLVIWTKFLLRITVALSVTMIIYNAIKYMIEIGQGKEWMGTETQKHLIYVIVGLIVALSSVIIITILSSAVGTISQSI